MPGRSSVPGTWSPARRRPGRGSATARRATAGAHRTPGHLHGLRIPVVVGVVAAGVAQVDTAGEGDVAVGCAGVAQHHQLLVVRSAEAHPLVEQHLAAGRLDRVAEMLVLLLAVGELVQMRAPHQALDDDAAFGGLAEQLGDGGPVVAQSLVGVAAPVGEEQVVAAAHLVHLGGEPVEVGGAVDQRLDPVARAPVRHRGGRVSALARSSGTNPLTRTTRPLTCAVNRRHFFPHTRLATFRLTWIGNAAVMSLRVAVTGPTGEIGISTIEALEDHPDVTQIVGMARRPFDPAERNWTKTVYRQGDILDRDAVDALVADVDVVVHLAFIIMGTREESARINLAGTRNVFEATVAARPAAAAGLHLVGRGVRLPLGQPRADHRGRADARLAGALLLRAEGRVRSGADRDHGGLALEVFVLRPCIVAGPKAPALAEAMPWNELAGSRCVGSPRLCRCSSRRCRTPARRCSWCTTTTSRRRSPWRSPPPPRRRVRTTSPGDGLLSMSDVGDALGARPFKVPPRRGGRHVRSDLAAAVRSVGAGVATRRPDIGGHGHA